MEKLLKVEKTKIQVKTIRCDNGKWKNMISMENIINVNNKGDNERWKIGLKWKNRENRCDNEKWKNWRNVEN